MVTYPEFGKMPLTASCITDRTRSKLVPTVDPLVTPKSKEKSKSGNKVKKKYDRNFPSNVEHRETTLQQKKDILGEIMANKEATKERESIAKKAAAQEAKTLEEATAEKEPKISNT